MTDPAGKLSITLNPGGTTIASTRPVRAAAVFVGRTAVETMHLLPALFSICATAQSATAVAAIEQALGRVPSPTLATLRLRLVAAETLREHLWRILLDWPKCLQEAPDAAAMAHVMHQTTTLRSALAAGSAPFAPDATAGTPDQRAVDAARGALVELSTDRVFGRPPANWRRDVTGLTTLAAWAIRTDTAAGRLVRQVIQAGQAGRGRSDVAALPALAATDLDRRLAVKDPATDAFIAQPTWGDQPRETSPLTRQLGTPLVQDLTARFGNGLLTRLAAQLVEVAGLLSTDGETTDVAPPPPTGLAPGTGIAQVQAARGLLVHRVQIDAGRVTGYRILAPTEWNFHPRGVVATGLDDIDANTAPDQREPLARLFIAAVDPCVDYDLQLPGPVRRPRTPD